MADMEEVLQQAQAIEGRICDLNTNIQDLTAYGKKNRKFIRWLAASLVFDVLLSLGLGGVAWKASITSDQARVAAVKAAKATSDAALNAQNVHAACVSSNDGRKLSHDLWEYVLEVPPTHPLTAGEQKTREQFKVYIDKTFAQRNCAVVAPTIAG